MLKKKKNLLPFEYGLYKGWFFSFAPLSILSVAHYKEKSEHTSEIQNALSINIYIYIYVE